MKRVQRLKGSPHTIAIGFASGVFASFTPFVGLHFIIGFLIAWILRGSLIASALGTFVGNPITFPFIWVTTLNVGNWILGLENSSDALADLETKGVIQMFVDIFNSDNVWGGLYDILIAIFLPMLTAGIPMGIFFGTIFYLIIKQASNAYQNRRVPPTGTGGVINSTL